MTQECADEDRAYPQPVRLLECTARQPAHHSRPALSTAVGTSSARGEYPKDRPYKVPQLLSTIYQAIGIDPSQTFVNGSGRPMYILDDRDPVKELL